MKDISLINEIVCNTLKSENNEVIYTSWLSFAENAKYDGDNIIINVPNNFVKEAIEERYSEDLEQLYRGELNFSKLIVKSDSEFNFNILSDSPSTEVHMNFIPEYKSYVCW